MKFRIYFYDDNNKYVSFVNLDEEDFENFSRSIHMCIDFNCYLVLCDYSIAHELMHFDLLDKTRSGYYFKCTEDFFKTA